MAIDNRSTPVPASAWTRSVRRVVAAVVLCAGFAGCNDLTAPLPSIAGTYQYTSSSELYTSLNRTGTLTIVDLDPRTARFDGDFTYIAIDGRQVSGQLTGAFVRPDRIYFRFLTDRFQYHEADFSAGFAAGEIFLQGLTYASTGSTFTLRWASAAAGRAAGRPWRAPPELQAAPE